MAYKAGKYDCIVVGTGHAGCEAALAAARLGHKTLVCTLNMDNIGLMPCNPSLGGPAKGQLVREIDALGGEMGLNIDATHIQMRMLNTGKGPAVQASRAQADKIRYQQRMTAVLQNQPNLDLKQVLVEKLLVGDHKKVIGIETETGARFEAQCVILCTGTYLRGKIIIGETNYAGGPNGQRAAMHLTQSLNDSGVTTGRFKTGTPARIDRRSADLEQMQTLPGDDEPQAFSFMNDHPRRINHPCYLTYTNRDTHQTIRDNIHRSPLFTGKIEGTGPRYCPSIEDKVVRFADRERHQIFIEPEGLDTQEMYVQGMSSSLPEEVQLEFLRTVKGLEHVEVMRTGYAIEYDYVVPTQLKLSLEHKDIEGLFCAGQINGSSGYEEAAAQGLLAGINAVRKIQNKEPLMIKRSEGYIGVLIDDLVTKGTNEPYRLMTSRAEYRLLLRQDNADLRLTEKGHAVGLVTAERYQKYLTKKQAIDTELERLNRTQVSPGDQNLCAMLEQRASTPLNRSVSLYELLRRPELSYKDLNAHGFGADVNAEVAAQVEIHIKYEGYIEKQLQQIERFERMERKLIPEGIDFMQIKGISTEARQKLNKLRPVSVGQASRISGVSPADIGVLLVFLEQQKRLGAENGQA